jgi:hypothetical protein
LIAVFLIIGVLAAVIAYFVMGEVFPFDFRARRHLIKSIFTAQRPANLYPREISGAKNDH